MKPYHFHKLNMNLYSESGTNLGISNHGCELPLHQLPPKLLPPSLTHSLVFRFLGVFITESSLEFSDKVEGFAKKSLIFLFPILQNDLEILLMLRIKIYVKHPQADFHN